LVWGFSQKKHLKSLGFAQEYLRSCSGYGPGRSVKKRSKSSSLYSKEKFLTGGWVFFVSDVISGRLLGHSGPGRQPLGDSISLKFLLETWLQSESFDTLGDLLGFRVENL